MSQGPEGTREAPGPREPRESPLDGTHGTIVVRSWPNDHARYVALLAHGYGEHIGRYDHVADVLVRHGAAVYGPDHAGHGKSAGERALVTDFEDVVADLHRVEEQARAAHPGLPVVLIGHSMGGMIAARYAQHHGAGLAALVLSAPVLGPWVAIKALLELDEIPDIPIDVATLSRDPEVGKIYAADPLVWHGPFKRTTVAAFDRALAAIADGGRLGALPTLWLHGTGDELVPQADTRIGIEQIRGDDFTEVMYPDARHEVFNEINRAEVLAEVTAFIDRALG
ncbi:MAG TPA: alpha/beta hydrolase [Streptosporangiaceae bacterium]|nr:alpha/beta hydrolase [Streptosporangiaceae bacterium]